MGIVPTGMELILEQTQQGISHEVSKVSSSVSIDSNKHEIMNLTVCQSNASVLNTKTINAVNDDSNIVFVSCGKDVFMLSHEKYVARYALSRDSMVIHLVLWIVYSGCSKHMTGNLKLLRNFIEKLMGIVRFGNDHFIGITVYQDYVHGNLTICHVYYVEGLRHNLFLVGQFCDVDLEVIDCSSSCFVRNLEGDDLLTYSQESNLYTISIFELVASSLVCLMCKATSTKSWLWHQRLSYLNFSTINPLTSKDLVDGLSKLEYDKDSLCSACEQGKIKKASFPPKLVASTESKLELLHMDLCGLIKDDIGIFIGYSESSRDSSEELNEIPSQQDLDNLFGPLYEEYYAPSTFEVSNNSAANTLDDEDTLSPSSIIFEDSDASQMVSSLEEPITKESLTPVLETHSDEQIQKDVTELDENTIMHSYKIHEFEEADSSSNYQDPSNNKNSINNIASLINGLRIIHLTSDW
nr:integrase, catalytic region, zinc finger, CCHC-type, peptidase aspartic, catalytic [Tanacetum cinerariifolium]